MGFDAGMALGGMNNLVLFIERYTSLRYGVADQGPSQSGQIQTTLPTLAAIASLH